MKPEDYSESEVRRQYDDALRRAATYPGPRVGWGTVVHFAKEEGYRPPERESGPHTSPFDLDAAIPRYSPTGMPPRDFAGPSLEDARLFPTHASSLFVSLGGVGKSTTLITLAAHMAAAKPWGGERLRRRRVLMFSIEENQSELNRKYGAAVHSWTSTERDDAAENLRLISCLAIDARLTKAVGRQVDITDFNQKIIAAAHEFEADVIILDHLQGFASGDLNNSDTATALARASNEIVAKTRAAVVLAAHVSKISIGAQQVSDGFTTGTLAFENAARQVTGVIPLPEGDATKFGVQADDYLRMEMPKNSYGPSRRCGYLMKVPVPDFHTITVEPCMFSAPHAPISAEDRLKDALCDYVKNNPATTPNRLDRLAGKTGRFKASKAAVRRAMNELEAEGRVSLNPLTPEQRQTLGVPWQATQVYECTE